jgi:hypothetical protein
VLKNAADEKVDIVERATRVCIGEECFMKNPVLASVALGAMLLAEGIINQAAAVFVRTPPPRPVSVGIVGKRPGPEYV